jgi:hypothetical protein
LTDDQVLGNFQAGPNTVNIGNTGDFDDDGDSDATDIDLLGGAIRTGSTDVKFDVNNDGQVNDADFQTHISVTKHTWLGDANLDGVFSSSDFVAVFQIGEYEDAVAGNSGWAEGDWNHDADFTSGDFVAAFQQGGYEKGPRPGVAGIPEPTTAGLLSAAVILVAAARLRSRRR